MKLTIRKTLLLSLGLFVLLGLAALAVTFFRINRTVIVDGVFDYRKTYPVTVEGSGFVERVLVKTDSRVKKGDVLAVLSNRDLDKEIADMELRLAMGTLELESMKELAETERFITTQDMLSLKELLDTKVFELDYYKALQEMNQKLYQDGSITKERYDAGQLAFRSVQGAVAEIEIQLTKKKRKQVELEAHPSSARELKQKALELDAGNLEYLRARRARLRIQASESGVLLSAGWDSLAYTYVAKGTRVADIVTFDEIDFVGFTKDTDIIRIKEGQTSYFDVEIFRRKVFVSGIVTNIGYKAVAGPGGLGLFPVTIELTNKKFFDRNQELYIQAGVKGQAVVIVEEGLSLIALVWEKILDFADFGVYIE